MLVEEYIQIIEEEFSYLFTRYGFSVTYSEQVKRYRYRAGIESKICKMLFVREQGAGLIYLGPLSAPFLNEYSNQWIEIANLLMYLTHQRINWDMVNDYEGEARIRPIMKLIADKLEPFCNKVFEMFSSNEMIATWKPKYEQYIDQIFNEK